MRLHRKRVTVHEKTNVTGVEPQAAAPASADTGQHVSSSGPVQSLAEPAGPAHSTAPSDYTPPTSTRDTGGRREMQKELSVF